MKNPKISVILPVYNAELYLREAIDSILNQTVKDFELIIINDGSTDGSEKIILSYKDEKIKYIKNPINLKIIKSLNIGIDLANGKYISRMDADDIAFYNMFEKQLEIFENNIDVDLVNPRTYIMSNNGVYYRKSKTVISINHLVQEHVVFLQNMISHPGIMIKSILLKNNRYDENEVDIPEDVGLWHRVLRKGAKCITMDDYVLYYRNTPTGIINTTRFRRLNKRIKYCKNILNKYYQNFFSDKQLELILGKYENTFKRDLISLDNSLVNYISFIDDNYNLDKDSLKDLFFWKTHLIFFTSVNSLKLPSNKKTGILIFILLKLPFWFLNKSWRNNFVKVLFSYRKRMINN